MKKIVSVLRPFAMAQNIYVYEDGNKIDLVSASMDNLETEIFALIEKYDINQVELVGPKGYAKGIKKQIENAEMAKYNINKIEINLI